MFVVVSFLWIGKQFKKITSSIWSLILIIKINKGYNYGKKLLNFGFVPASLSTVFAVVSCQGQQPSSDAEILNKIANEATFNVENHEQIQASKVKIE